MSINSKDNLVLRLRKIEGQVRGIQKMIDDGKDCASVINKISTSGKALDKVKFLIPTNKMQDCNKNNDVINQNDQKVLGDTLKLFLTLSQLFA